MENAVEALKMAGSVLLFVFALSVCMLAFTNARQSLDLILNFADRESLTIENDSRYYYLSNKGNNLSRVVGKETIIPTLYRSSSENYAVVFKFKGDRYLYKHKSSLYGDNLEEEINILDPELINVADKEKFIEIVTGILYTNDFTFENGLSTVYNRTPNLNVYLGEHTFTEEVGTYYIDDLNNNNNNTSVNDDDENNTYTGHVVSDNNKTLKRIITYTEL